MSKIIKQTSKKLRHQYNTKIHDKREHSSFSTYITTISFLCVRLLVLHLWCNVQIVRLILRATCTHESAPLHHVSQDDTKAMHHHGKEPPRKADGRVQCPAEGGSVNKSRLSCFSHFCFRFSVGNEERGDVVFLSRKAYNDDDKIISEENK